MKKKKQANFTVILISSLLIIASLVFTVNTNIKAREKINEATKTYNIHQNNCWKEKKYLEQDLEQSTEFIEKQRDTIIFLRDSIISNR